MKTIEDIHEFLDDVLAWTSHQPDVHGVALVGSYARGAAREDSDIDLVILAEEPRKYLDDPKWIERFGRPARHHTREYGKLTSLHAWYQNGREVEFGITTPDWAAIPLEAGTRGVISNGMIVLFERGNLLSRHLRG